jgi:hypothetical protein
MLVSARRMISPCCARAASGHAAAALEKGDEITSLQTIELHFDPRQPGRIGYRIGRE